ncbi:hypothetical protein [Atopobium fossor]|uniref:hypothetical protein n=1 Tax=Atopobium fossor TaxID=39487 RepID=UPI000416BE11|nr:hypothetical protein [Atopobium fossor]
MSVTDNNTPASRRGRHFKGETSNVASDAAQSRPARPVPAPARKITPTPSVSAVSDKDASSSVTSTDAPRPAPLDDTSSFATLTSNEGAVIPNRTTASAGAAAARASRKGTQRSSQKLSHKARQNVSSHTEKATVSRKHLLVVILAALVVVVVVIAASFMLFKKPANNSESTRVERTQASKDDVITYDDYSYATKQNDDGSYSLTRTAQGSSEPLELFKLEGTPVGMVLYDGALIIPENLSDGSWDIVAWTMGDGSVATKVADKDGNPVKGNGVLSKIELKDNSLVLSDDNNASTTVPLT